MVVNTLCFRRQSSDVEFCIESRLPICLHPSYWQRHSLSFMDIETIMQYIPTKLMWLMAMTLGYTCRWNDIHPGSASSYDVTTGVKTDAMQHILRLSQYQDTGTNILYTPSINMYEHTPPIPLHKVSDTVFAYVSTKLVDDYRPLALYDIDNVIPSIVYLLEWGGLQWAPIRFEGDYILCTRVQPADESESFTYWSVPGYTHAPMVGLYNSVHYYLSDESMLITT